MSFKNYLLGSLLLIATCCALILHPLVYQTLISSQLNKVDKNVKVVAHRGANQLAPENTLAAISKALEHKVDMIEIDVHLTKDNKLIVIHDETLERTTNGTGNVSDYTLIELKKLDAGSWFNKAYEREKLPTLKDVLQLINGKTTCLIEIKWTKGSPYLGIEELVANEILKQQATSWTIVQSFESLYLEKIHKTHPNIKLGKLLIGSWHFPFPFYFDYKFHWGTYTPPEYIDWVNFYSKRATPVYIKSLKSKGVKVGVFTPSSKEELIKQMNMGVDAVITNEPKLAKRIRNPD